MPVVLISYLTIRQAYININIKRISWNCVHIIIKSSAVAEIGERCPQ